MPQYNSPKPKNLSIEAAKFLRHERSIDLAEEGVLSKACNALVSAPPLGQTADVTRNLKAKHPPAAQAVNLQTLGNASSSLVALAYVDLVEKCIQSFHKLSGSGP